MPTVRRFRFLNVIDDVPSKSQVGARFALENDGEVKRLIVISPYWDERLGAFSALAERLRPRFPVH